MKRANIIIIGELPHIDPRRIPVRDYVIGCRVLAESITRALENPQLRAEYEEWRRKRAAQEAAIQGE